MTAVDVVGSDIGGAVVVLVLVLGVAFDELEVETIGRADGVAAHPAAKRTQAPKAQR